VPDKKDSSLQGLTRLITDATIGITDLVEAMHKRVVHPPLLPSTPIQHLVTDIAGITYNNVRWSTKLIGGQLDKILGRLAPIFGDIKTSHEKEVLQAVLNGVVGDYLEVKDNPLKINMQFRYKGNTVAYDLKELKKLYPLPSGKILLMIHGSCMNDLQWNLDDHDHGATLAALLGMTPLYLHYNSGRHISSNGQQLSELLEALTQDWPIPITELSVVAHSMGGLVLRSAIHYGQQSESTWTKQLTKMVFLGSPHHGAPLEKVGNYLDFILKSIPYTKPFARLAKIRSAGVTDLRYGNLLDEDWEGKNRFAIKGDQRQHLPLPSSVDSYSIAAVLATTSDSISTRTIGDTMVDVKSALGQHKKEDKTLQFKKGHTWIAYETNHIGLLKSPEVFNKILAWFSTS